MWTQMLQYFENNADNYLARVFEHLAISIPSLLIAILIGVPIGALVVKYNRSQKAVVSTFGVLRVIPSLAILLLLIPLIGTGIAPAMTALVFLAVPPILMSTIAGLESVPAFMLETAAGLGMTEKQAWYKVRFPLAYPLILTGVKTASVEIIASATLAAKIGAGGLGELIFAGMGLYRFDLLLIGGMTVALFSIGSGLFFDRIDRLVLRNRFT